MDDNGEIEPVRIFKCPCEGNKFKLAGEPNGNPTANEAREYADYIAAGCSEITISIEQFWSENWTWCPKIHLALPLLAVRCVLVDIDAEILQMCIEMYQSGEKLTAIKWLIEEAKRDRYTFGIKWAQEYFEKIGLDKVDEQ